VNIESTQAGTHVVVKVAGRMNAENSHEFEDACKVWTEQGVTQLIVDMSELTYISSMGLRSFIEIGKLLQGQGGALRLCSLTGLVKQVFEITRLNSIFPVHDSVDSAIAGV
jgi:stage II sporulation protein AA (anti-sigma F factor antagonist)